MVLDYFIFILDQFIFVLRYDFIFLLNHCDIVTRSKGEVFLVQQTKEKKKKVVCLFRAWPVRQRPDCAAH